MMKSILNRIFGEHNGVKPAPWSTIEALTKKKWAEIEGVSMIGIFAAAGVIVHVIEITAGKILALHEHEDATEKFTVIKGKVVFNQRTELEVGESQFIPKGYAHEVEAVADSTLIVIYHRTYK